MDDRDRWAGWGSGEVGVAFRVVRVGPGEEVGEVILRVESRGCEVSVSEREVLPGQVDERFCGHDGELAREVGPRLRVFRSRVEAHASACRVIAGRHMQ